jgi:carbon storage regulator
MLVLKRRDGESILIGKDITIRVVESHKGSVKIGIIAPKNVPIVRPEIFTKGVRDDTDGN